LRKALNNLPLFKNKEKLNYNAKISKNKRKERKNKRRKSRGERK
jgi:hypothetical protein